MTKKLKILILVEVVVDVVLAEKSFSIRKVNSTVPERKYNQWANNLQREIVHQASR